LRLETVGIAIIVLLIVAGLVLYLTIPSPSQQPSINVAIHISTDKASYHPGDAVTITGSVEGIPEGSPIGIEVRGPGNIIIWVDQVEVRNGQFQSSFTLPTNVPTGNYTIHIAGGGAYSTALFNVSEQG